MLFPFSDPAAGAPEPPGDFNSNYRQLKQLINKALKDGTPLEDLHLIPRMPAKSPSNFPAKICSTPSCHPTDQKPLPEAPAISCAARIGTGHPGQEARSRDYPGRLRPLRRSSSGGRLYVTCAHKSRQN